jgi:Ran GTPase-activating protein (RanGAP) involved in mRNA processing and transport
MLKFYTPKLNTTALALVCYGVLVSGSVYAMKEDPNAEQLNIHKQMLKEEIKPEGEKLAEAINIIIQAVELAEQEKKNTRKKDIKVNFNVGPLFETLNNSFLQNDIELKNERMLKMTPLGTLSKRYFEQLKNAFGHYAEKMGKTNRKKTLLNALETAYEQKGFELGYFSMLPKVLRNLIIDTYLHICQRDRTSDPSQMTKRIFKLNKFFAEEIDSSRSYAKIPKIPNTATDDQIAHFIKSRARLKELDLYLNQDNYGGLENFSQALGEHKTLKKLLLSSVGRRTTFQRGEFDNFSKALEKNTVIEELKLYADWFLEEHMKSFSEALKVNKSIKVLILNRSNFTTDAMKLFAKGLKKNTSVTKLELISKFSNEGMQYLAKALKINKYITDLDLRYYIFDVRGMGHFSEALKQNISLTTLDMNSLESPAEAMNYLLEGIKVNKSIKTLNLYRSKMCDEHMGLLAEGLKDNRSLTNLNLQETNLSDKSLMYLSPALEQNKILTLLNLSYNEFKSAAMDYISNGLKLNTSIKTLDLSGNKIDDEGMKFLVKGLAKNTTLKELNMNDNKVDSEGMECFANFLRTNHSLKKLLLAFNLKSGIIGPFINTLSECLKTNWTLTSLYLGRPADWGLALWSDRNVLFPHITDFAAI